ncbi:hypothetical protein L6279_03425, partial [Candidatus Parcubacteria bacterium]|nr:hypothetical protein [Candidatus Parcubacteria bacterium]
MEEGNFNKKAATKTPAIKFGFLFGLVFVLLSASIVFGKENLKNAFGDFDSFAGRVGEKTDLAIGETFNSTKNFISLTTEG